MPRHSAEATGIGDALARFNKIETLQDQVRSHVSAIEELLANMGRVAGGDGAARVGKRRGRRPGRPAGKRVAAKAGRRGGRRAKRGALKAAIHKVLAGGKAAKPAEIVKALPKVGFKSASTPKVLYTTVYLSLRKDPNIQK